MPDKAIRDLIRYYTREAGVRSLERELGNLARKTVRDLAREKRDLDHHRRRAAGQVRGRARSTATARPTTEDQVGIITGLAYTEFGGDILTIEAVKMPGKGRMSITGNLKDVMKELISAANSLRPQPGHQVRHRAAEFERTDVHIHVPDGATPKDGPSAGAAMATAIVSVLTGIPIRKDIAMTGEVTLRGRVTGHRRPEGKAARGSALRREDRADPRREREGPGRHPGEREGRAEHHPDDHRRRRASPTP